MQREKTVLPISLTLSILPLLAIFYVLLNGYVLNLVGGYRADFNVVFAGLVAELALTLWFARSRVSIQFDPLEMAGFLAVVAGVWTYFIVAAWPTLLPPSQSVDAVRHYVQAMFSYPQGTLVSWYPAGGAFLVAAVSHWIGWSPLRVLHPTAAVFLALSAGAVYGMASELLPSGRRARVLALIAPAMLFAPWSYFAGAVDWEQYFFAQVFAQYLTVAALWFVMRYAAGSEWIYLALAGVAILGIVATYPYLVALPVALLVILALVQLFKARLRSRSGVDEPRNRRLLLVALLILLALMVVAGVVLERGGILSFETFGKASQGDVGEGGVTNPSLENLGGPLFLLLALGGLPLAWRAGPRGRTLLAFLLAWVLQLGALFVAQPFLRLSGYRLDKTFYILVFPLAILAALPCAAAVHRWLERIEYSPRRAAGALVVFFAAASAAVLAVRAPVRYSPFAEDELNMALWAKANLDTYQISFVDPQLTRSYWLAVGLWSETLPPEYFQWVPEGAKLGPSSYEEWLRNPMWPRWIFVPDVTRIAGPLPAVVHRNGNSAILEKETLPATPPTPAQPLPLYFSDALKVLGYDLPKRTYAPGETITVTTTIESLRPPRATSVWRAELADGSGRVVSKGVADPFGNKYPVQRWPPGQYSHDVFSLPLDPGLDPGRYELRMGLYRVTDGEGYLIHNWQDEWDPRQTYYNFAPLGRIKVPLPPPAAGDLEAAKPLDARVGEDFSLLRYAAQLDGARQSVHLTLYWQCLRRTESDYTVFVHLLDSEGRVVAQKDAPPHDGAYQTSIWDPQEIVREDYDLAVPAGATPPVSIEIGMYSQPDQKRLPAGDSDHVSIGLGQP